MGIYISTNLFRPKDLEGIFSLVDKANKVIDDNEKIGIELFPEWQSEAFEEFLDKNIDRFKNYKISLHGPYYNTEHSADKKSKEYNTSKDYFIKTLKLSNKLNSSYIVYHHNNCKVINDNKEKMIKVSSENLLELNELANEYSANIIVENAGVIFNNNMLFTEEEFIEMAKKIDNFILIDIGHAFANKWDLYRVISELKDKIVSYHLHNNNGINDNHNSIMDGKLDIKEFIDLYKKYTPNADLVIEYGAHYNSKIEKVIDDVKWIYENINKCLRG